MSIISRMLPVWFLTLAIVAIYSIGAYAQFPVIEQGEVTPNDIKLGNPIDPSKPGELTIASFNVRNLGNLDRSLKDFEAIVDLVDEADVAVFQECGLGLFGESPLTGYEKKRWEIILAAFTTYFGSDWNVTTADKPTGSGQGSETTILAHRKMAKDFRIAVDFKEYIDLGERRDMAVFQARLEGYDRSESLLLGSVHLKPRNPYRGEEMIKAADWLVEQKVIPAIVLGDFNWGYDRPPRVENYRGEDHVTALHDQQKIFQVFKELSYKGDGGPQDLRTNMGFRKGRKMYSQFLLSPSLASRMADGGKLLHDTGFIAFGMHNQRMKDLIRKDVQKMEKGLEYFIEEAGIDSRSYTEIYNRVEHKVKNRASVSATYRISDHRPIWIQLKLF